MCVVGGRRGSLEVSVGGVLIGESEPVWNLTVRGFKIGRNGRRSLYARFPEYEVPKSTVQ